MEASAGRLWAVWAIVERGARGYRARVGVGRENDDGTISVRLDAVPIQGRLLLGPWAPDEAVDAAGEVAS